MLEPQERRLLLDTLRPPEAYALDFAIATTFTLDLLALLTAPLGFTFFELEGEAAESLESLDPMVVLHTIRDYADRMSIFCQAGRIAIPRKQQTLFAHLEGSVIPVLAPTQGGVFHPKLWVLRFTAPELPVRYRVICLTRNLTFDRSWDTSLVLEGEVVQRKNAFAANRPLADFITALPRLGREVPDKTRRDVAVAADEVLRVDFIPPDPFDAYAFRPLGIDGYRRSPFTERADRMLVMSPFLSPDAVRSFATMGKGNILISRMDSLQALSATDLAGYESVYTLNPDTYTEVAAEGGADIDPLAPAGGLHAKLFVADAGWNSIVWTGSANASSAALHKNVEFLVELEGKKSTCGVKAILDAEKNETTFRSLLELYTPSEAPLARDPGAVDAERRVEAARIALSVVQWTATVSAIDDGTRYSVSLAADAEIALGAGITGRVWPVTVGEGVAQHLPERFRELGPLVLSLEGLTTFYAFVLSAGSGDASASARFVLSARLIGAPADRREKLLMHLLRDPQAVLRFLLLLLAADNASPDAAGDTRRWVYGSVGLGNGSNEALLEALLRALDRSPASLDRVARTIDDLRSTPEGAALLPSELDEIWLPIWAARKRVTT